MFSATASPTEANSLDLSNCEQACGQWRGTALDLYLPSKRPVREDDVRSAALIWPLFWRVLLLCAALCHVCALAVAQDYPSRVIKMICGFPAGGNVDAIARVIANEMAVGLGQPVVVETKPGMVGSLAAESVSRATPDGYTLITLPSAHAVTGALYKNLKYKPVDDFAWISTVSFYPFVVSVRADSRFKTLAELLAAAREKPGRVSYGS
jgi:tripartite-type tricarboxylate transporter receptor subunit TctC